MDLGYTNWLAILRCSSYLSQLFHYGMFMESRFFSMGYSDTVAPSGDLLDHPMKWDDHRFMGSCALKSACN